MATKTVGSGGDYATLAAWAAYANALSSLTEDEICNVIGQVTDSASVTLNPNPSGAFKVRIRPAPGYEIAPESRLFPGISGRARLVNTADFATGYILQGSKIVMEGIEVQTTASNSSAINISAGARVARCIIKTPGNGIICSSGSTTTSEVYACGIFASNRGVDSAVQYYLNVIGCTIVGGNIGLRSEYADCIYARNNVVFNAGAAFSGTLTNGSSHNAHSGGTTPGTGWTTNVQTNVTSADFVSTTVGSEDYRRSPSSTKLGNTGIASGLSVDLYNQTRTGQGSAYDIGAYEYPEVVSSGSVSGGATLGDVGASGDVSSIASSMAGSATLGDVSAAGSIGLAPGVVTSAPLKNWSGTVLASTTIPKVALLRVSDMSIALVLSDQVTNGVGVLAITSSALQPGVKYLLVTCNADGSAFGCEPYTAA